MADIYAKHIKSANYGEGQYLGMLRWLLPRGKIWGFSERIVSDVLQDIIPPGTYLQDSVDAPDIVQDVAYSGSDSITTLLGRLLSVFGAELARLEIRAWQLWGESVSGLSVELLTEWETMHGLPNHCTVAVADQDERQITVHTKQYTTAQTTTEQFYIDYAAGLGFGITLGRPTGGDEAGIAGVARAGLNRCVGRGANSTYEITVNTGTGSLAVMQCIFLDLIPAHIIIEWVDAR